MYYTLHFIGRVISQYFSEAEFDSMIGPLSENPYFVKALAWPEPSQGEPIQAWPVPPRLSFKTGVECITAERTRQITDEHWTPEHDDGHRGGELTAAAACYSTLAWQQVHPEARFAAPSAKHVQGWPWEDQWWKPSDDPIRNLVKAGALIAAEIDRLQRKKEREGKA